MDGKRIFYVEDDEIIRANFSDLFSTSGYEVKACESFEQAKAGMSHPSDFDLAVLDVELEGDRLAGIELCRLFRERYPSVPIVLLSAHKQVQLQQLCFQMGADEYLSKDIDLSLLLIRLSSIIARYSTLLAQSEAVNDSDITVKLNLDKQRRIAYCNEQKLNLNDVQYAMLAYLVSHAYSVVSTDQLQEAAGVVVEANTIVAHIRTIRKELECCAGAANSIETVRGRGYRWV